MVPVFEEVGEGHRKYRVLAVTPAADVVFVELWDEDADNAAKMAIEDTTRVVDLREVF